ncbi:cytochrome P450 6k1-like [Pieris napi]|uniref:cytochrome P450 6k1-like n=2 Tax=Pieris napi TaxID=78633 RepID=UPI001FBB4360|nr:cytochrome P450 6k1-like [Pieris napi]
MFTLIFFGLTLVLFLIYFNGKYNEIYWRKRNVKFYPRNKVTGVFWDFLTQDKAVFEILCELYKDYKNEPAVGIGGILTPTLYVTDPVNIQHVLASDFNSFNHRGIDTNEGDLLADNILLMHGNRWKLMRQNMTPLFTSKKLKSMYYIIDKSALDFITLLKTNPDLWHGKTFDTLSTFCSAAVGAAVFGVSTKSIFDSPFLHMARDALEPSVVNNIKFSLANVSTSLFRILNIKLFKRHEKFFIGAIKQVIKERKQDNVKKHDFADICVMLQNSGNLIDKETGLQMTPTDELLAAQAFFFFVAGVEPTATAIFATLVELGRNPEHLARLHEEIDASFAEHNNEMPYDAVVNMTFLDMALNEALRMHPPIGFSSRQCVKDTVLPTGNIKVDKGTRIFTPIFELHHDERYYEEPEVYKPERFSAENRNKIADITYMPFGKGNRICVGMRYATLQTKAGLIHLLRNFTVKTIIEDGGMRYSKQQVQVRLNNVDVELIPRQNVSQ